MYSIVQMEWMNGGMSVELWISQNNSEPKTGVKPATFSLPVRRSTINDLLLLLYISLPLNTDVRHEGHIRPPVKL